MLTRRDAAIGAFLRSVPVFQDLKGPSLEVLYQFLEERRWEVGETVCAEGEFGRTMYIIREGEIEVQRRSAKGNQVPVVMLGPGECFGEMTLIEQQPRSATCVVKKRAVTYSLTNVDLYDLYKTENFAFVIILQNISRLMSRRLRKADGRIVEFLEQLAQHRKAAHKQPAKKAKKPAAKKKAR